MSSPYTPISSSSSHPGTGKSSPLSANLDYMSRAKHQLSSTLSTRRPWRQIFDYHALSCPRGGLPEAVTRLRTNCSYFRMNFAIVVLLVLFLSLLWHPVSLIVFIVMMAAWLFLYFLRDEPLLLFGRQIDDRLVLLVLGILIILFLILTGVTVSVVVALAVGLAVVGLYSVFRRTDDLFLDEEAAVTGGFMAGRTTTTSSAGGKRPLDHPTSSSQLL